MSTEDDSNQHALVEVHEDDVSQMNEMIEWLKTESDIAASSARRYCALFVVDGVVTAKRLGKKITKSGDYLSSLGIDQDDEEEILEALSRLGYYSGPVNLTVAWGATEARANPSYVEDNINEILKNGALSKEEDGSKSDSDADAMSDTEDHDRLHSPIHKKNEAVQSYESTGEDEDIKDNHDDSFVAANSHNVNPGSFLTSEDLLLSSEGGGGATIGRDRSESKKSDHGAHHNDTPSAGTGAGTIPPSAVNTVMFRDRAGSVISRERAASTFVLAERKQRSSTLFKRIVAIEKTEKFKELIRQADSLMQNVLAATEAMMEAGVLGELTNVLAFVEGSLDKQRAMYRQGNIHTIIQGILMEMGKSAHISERCMQVVAVCCRHSDDDKGSACHELARSFGMVDSNQVPTMGRIIKSAFKTHAKNLAVVASICDAIRSLCCLESNRNKLISEGMCELLGQSLTHYIENRDISGWMCRAIGHLCLSSEEARERTGASGAPQFIVEILEKHQNSCQTCIEACWAIRNISHQHEGNIDLFNDASTYVHLAAVFSNHWENEHFAKECCRALSSLIKTEEDDILPKIINSGVIEYLYKSLKKYDESEQLACYAFELMFYISCHKTLCIKLVQLNIMKYISTAIETFAGSEWTSIWCLRTLSKLTEIDNAGDKIQNLGLCEHSVASVQRMVKSPVVCKFGCLAIGLIAKIDSESSQRLSDAGACEICVMALNRHENSQDTAENICTAIHWLASSIANNLQWLGANGACEAIISIIKKHIPSLNVYLIQSACLALGTLAFNEDGNILKFKAAGVSETICAAMRKYGAECDVATQMCRAIYALCYESSMVSELGNNSACGLVVAILNAHQNDVALSTQACYSIHALACKLKTEKVHSTNTKKLVIKGAIQGVIVAMQKFEGNDELQRAAAMAVASLGRLPANNAKLGELGCCELVTNAFANFSSNSSVAGKLALAVEVLCTDNQTHLNRFCDQNSTEDSTVVDSILDAFNSHDNNVQTEIECLRALIALISHPAAFKKIKSDSSVKQIVKIMRTHEKDPKVCHYSCKLISLIAADLNTIPRIVAYAGTAEITGALKHHFATDKKVVEWGSKCIVAMSKLSKVIQKFDNADTCSALSDSLKLYDEDAALVEHISAAIVCVASIPDSRDRLGASCCQNLQSAISKHQKSGNISGLICEAIFEMCGSLNNRNAFGDVGTVETVTSVLFTHVNTLLVAIQSCKAITALCRKTDTNNGSKAMAVDVSHALLEVLRVHHQEPTACQWASAAVAALADSDANRVKICEIETTMPSYLFNANILETRNKMFDGDLTWLVVMAMKFHKNNPEVVHQTLRAAKNMSTGNANIADRLSTAGIYKISLSFLKAYAGNVEINHNIVDLVGWILTHCTASSHPDIYANNSKIDLLCETLVICKNRDVAAQRFCAAIGSYLRVSKLPSKEACIAVLDSIQLSGSMNMPGSSQAARIAALQDIALAHEDNAALLGQSEHYRVIDSILVRVAKKFLSKDGEDLYVALFKAIHGIVTGNIPANQEKIASSQPTLKSIIKIFYSSLEVAVVAESACLVITSLVKNSKAAQNRLSVICEFIIDVVPAHSKSYNTILMALQCICALSHGNDHNKKKLAAAGSCEVIITTMSVHLSDWPDQRVLYWCARCVGELSANNFVNQVRFSKTTCSNLLISCLKKQVVVLGSPDKASPDPATQAQCKDMINWYLWAIANLVQKPPPKESKQPNFSKFLELDIVGTVMEIFETLKVKKSSGGLENMSTFCWTIRLMLNLCLNPSIKTKFVERNAASTVFSIFQLLEGDSEDVDSDNREYLIAQEFSMRLIRVLESASKKVSLEGGGGLGFGLVGAGNVSAADLPEVESLASGKQVLESVTRKPFSGPDVWEPEN